MRVGLAEETEFLLYLCGCCRRVAPAGDLSLVDTVARGELQFFVPGAAFSKFRVSGSGRGAGEVRHEA